MQSFYYVDSFPTKENKITSEIFFHFNFHNSEILVGLLLQLLVRNS